METYKEQAKLMSACSCGRELMAIKPENKRMPSQLTHKVIRLGSSIEDALNMLTPIKTPTFPFV